jgi:hypothetical protein
MGRPSGESTLSAASLSNQKLVLSPQPLLRLAFWQKIGNSTSQLIFLWHQIFLSAAAGGRSSVSLWFGGSCAESGPRPQESTHLSPFIAAGPRRVGGHLGVHLDECRSFSLESFFTVLVKEPETAHRIGVEPRALAVRTLLHRPRIASYKGWMRRW